MVYIYDDNGKCQEYSKMSGIEYILEYRCGGKYEGQNYIKDTKNIYIACSDKSYVEDWTKRNDILLDGHWVIQTNKGNYSYWLRDNIKIDWNIDYHFYSNKQYEKVY